MKKINSSFYLTFYRKFPGVVSFSGKQDEDNRQRDQRAGY